MKNAMKMAVTFCLLLILFEGYGQSVPSANDVIENDFVSFIYDGGNTTASFVPSTTGSLMTAPLLIHPNYGKTIKRSSMEDIMFENIIKDEVYIDNTTKEHPAVFAKN
jgi:hypothetical protein